MQWRIHHRTKTASTNDDARAGSPGDVFTADFQTAGRGRLDHKWLAPPGADVIMSVVLSVVGIDVAEVATLPLAVGLAVAKGVEPHVPGAALALKWPNDVLIDGKKVAGILCERTSDIVVAGIGINVAAREFPPGLGGRAVALGEFPGFRGSVAAVRDAVLAEISATVCARWAASGFASVWTEIAQLDFLKGRSVSVRQTDDDAVPVAGVCGGILPDGALDVGGVKVYAGEAHVEGVAS